MPTVYITDEEWEDIKRNRDQEKRRNEDYKRHTIYKIDTSDPDYKPLKVRF